LEIIFPNREMLSPKNRIFKASRDLVSVSKELNNRLAFVHGINDSIWIWLIGTPFLLRSFDFLETKSILSPVYFSFIKISVLLLLLGIPLLVNFMNKKKIFTTFENQFQKIFFKLLVNVGIGVYIAPILISAYDKMIFESGSALIVVSRLTLSISQAMPVVIGLVIVSFLSSWLSLYLDKTQNNQQLIKKQIFTFTWSFLTVLYLLIIALKLIYKIGAS
jgi:hypothetical protein